MRQIVYLLLVYLLFAGSCDNPLAMDMPESETMLVVEGWIEQGKSARILLSRSAPYFADIDSNSLRQFAVTTAKVSLIHEADTEILALKSSDTYFPPYVYYGTSIKGEPGHTYTIEIRSKGFVYSAVTSIPPVVKPDSVWFKKADNSDTLGLIHILLHDDPSEINYYRILTLRLGKDKKFTPTFTSVFSDRMFNGKTLEIPLSRGNSSLLDFENNRYFETNDTIVLKFCSIDRQQFEFWNAIQGEIQSSSNPFAVTNTEIQSNIENGLGIWGGYSASYDTVYTK
jgi:hypothetical protein